MIAGDGGIWEPRTARRSGTMKRKTFTILAVMASVIGLSGGFLQGALENRAAAGEIATDNARWVEWASQTPGPPTATPGPTSTPYTRICPPPTADRLTVFCYILEPTPGAATRAVVSTSEAEWEAAATAAAGVQP